jgi:hypothetical protein
MFLNDQRIQQLLLLPRNNYNSGVRMDSVGLLSQQPQDRVREKRCCMPCVMTPIPSAVEGVGCAWQLRER